MLEPWVVAYGESSLLPFGRVAAYFAKVTGEARYLEEARRLADLGIARYGRGAS